MRQRRAKSHPDRLSESDRNRLEAEHLGRVSRQSGVNTEIVRLYRQFRAETKGAWTDDPQEERRFDEWVRDSPEKAGKSRRQFLKGAAAGALAAGAGVHVADRLLMPEKKIEVPVPYPVPQLDPVTAYVKGFAEKHKFDAGILMERCSEFGLSPLLVLAQIEVESRFDTKALNKGSGDKGFMQIREDKVYILQNELPGLISDLSSEVPDVASRAKRTFELVIPDARVRGRLQKSWESLQVSQFRRQVQDAYDQYNPNQNIFVGVGYDGEMYGKFLEIPSSDESAKFMLAAYCGGLYYINAALNLGRRKEAFDTKRTIEKDDSGRYPPGLWQTWEYTSPRLRDEECFRLTSDKKKLWPKADEIIPYVDKIWSTYMTHIQAVEKSKSSSQ